LSVKAMQQKLDAMDADKIMELITRI
jgi:hypothetical protein